MEVLYIFSCSGMQPFYWSFELILSLSLVWKAVKELLQHWQVREDNPLADPSPPQSKQTYFLQIKYVAVGVYDA